MQDKNKYPYSLIIVPEQITVSNKEGFVLYEKNNAVLTEKNKQIGLHNLFSFGKGRGYLPKSSFLFGNGQPHTEEKMRRFVAAYENYLSGNGPTFPRAEDLKGLCLEWGIFLHYTETTLLRLWLFYSTAPA